MADVRRLLGGLEQLAAKRKSTLKALAPKDAGVLETRRVESARTPFELAGRSNPRKIELIDQPRITQPSTGDALDMSALGDWDLAHSSPLERARPTTVSDRALEAYTPENVRDFEKYVRSGATEGGLNWYDMSPLSRIALQEMSPEEFQILMAMNASTSARSNVMDQIKRASLAWHMRKQEQPWPMTNKGMPEGYGHLAHKIHSEHLAPLVRGESPDFSPIEQPKYASYYNNFMGNMYPLTADTHYQALHGYPMKKSWNEFNQKFVESPDFSKDVDYPFAESFSGERARRMGIPTPMYQSAAWVGGKDVTGVDDARPFTAVYNELVKHTADKLGITPTEALLKHLRGEIALQRPTKGRAAGGVVGYAGGGKVGWLSEMIRSLPKTKRQRLEFAADEVPGLEKHIRPDALEPYLYPDRNMLMNFGVIDPRKFERYAMPLENVFGEHEYDNISGSSGRTRSHKETIRALMNAVKRGRGFPELPYLSFDLPHTGQGEIADVSGHQGRHRMRALGELGYDRSLVGLMREVDNTQLPGRRYPGLPSKMHETVTPESSLEPEAWNSGFITLPFADGGMVKLAGGGKVGGLEALTQWLRYRLPKEYASQPIKRQEEMYGSGREIFSLGDDKLLKVAKRPRGLIEQGFEGHPDVQENLPRLFWRSPDSELAVIERMPLTPNRSRNFFEPMSQHYEKNSPVENWWSFHRDDPLMARMMEGAGLGKFSKFDLLGGDFFLRPDEHWAMRKPPMFSADPSETFKPKPTLLDPGALDRRLTTMSYEQSHAGKFRDVLNERLGHIDKSGRSLDDLIADASDPTISGGKMYPYMNEYGIGRGVEDFFGPDARWPAPISGGEATDELTRELRLLMPYRGPKTMSNTFASGGQIGARLSGLRRRMAGGGTVRNWLRGVKGSQFEDALARLKHSTPGTRGWTENDEKVLAGELAKRPQDRGPFFDAYVQHKKDYDKGEAMRKWIDTNLGNYIVRQHGTEQDPLKVQGLLPHPSAVVKHGAADTLETVAPDYLQHMGIIDQIEMSRLPKWYFEAVKQDLPRFRSHREYEKMVRPTDPNEPANRLAAEAKSRFGSSIPLQELMREADQKYQRRYTPKVEVHDLSRNIWGGYYEPEFRNVLDYLGAKVDPAKMNMVSVPDAIKNSRAWHAEMARQKAEADQALLGKLPVYKQYPTGERWVEMGGEDRMEPNFNRIDNRIHPDSEAAQSVGKALGHCYMHPETCKSYLQSGKLLTLLDAQGKPRVTANLTPGKSVASQPWQTETAHEMRQKYPGLVEDYAKNFATTGVHSMEYAKDFWPWLKKNRPEIHAEYDKARDSLGEIMGPQNTAPKEYAPESLPFVQDLVRSGNWNVEGRDLRNAGLLKHPNTGEYHSLDDLIARGKIMGRLPGASADTPLSYSDYVKYMTDREKGKMLGVPGDPQLRDRFFQHASQSGYTIDPPEMARGGQVESPADFPREGPDEQLMRAKLALQILQQEERAATPEERPVIAREIQRVIAIIQRLEAAGVGEQLGVKDMLAGSGGEQPADDPESADFDNETADMLGQFVSGDLGDDFFEKMMAEERFNAMS